MVRGQNHAVCPPQNIPILPRPKLREKVVAAQGLLSVLFLFAQVVFSFVKLISVGRSRSPLQKVEKTRKSRGIPGFFQQSSRDNFAAESMRNPHSLAAGYSVHSRWYGASSSSMAENRPMGGTSYCMDFVNGLGIFPDKSYGNTGLPANGAGEQGQIPVSRFPR